MLSVMLLRQRGDDTTLIVPTDGGQGLWAPAFRGTSEARQRVYWWRSQRKLDVVEAYASEGESGHI